MTHPINTVKKEIRILGLDTCRLGRVFGAVVRGGLYLDGVILIPSEKEVAMTIRESRYYPELRAVMLHDPRNRLRSEAIEKRAKLPMIQVSSSKPARKGYLQFKSKRGSLWLRTNIPSPTIEQVLSTTWTLGRLPEPARIAHLLARARIPPRPSSRR